MGNVSFNWNNLRPAWPDEVFSQFLSTDRSVSGAIIWFMIIVFVLSSAYIIWKIFSSKRRIKLYQNSNKTQDYLKFKKQYPYALPEEYWLGLLGCDFQNNRLIASLPSFLTAIGILGTFIGLQAGLGSVGSIHTQDTEALLQGVSDILSKAQVAFATSVWGVGTSLLFSFLEKFAHNLLQREINELIKSLDKNEEVPQSDISLLNDIKSYLEKADSNSLKMVNLLEKNHTKNTLLQEKLIDFNEKLILKSYNNEESNETTRQVFVNELKRNTYEFQKNMESLAQETSSILNKAFEQQNEFTNQFLAMNKFHHENEVNLLREMNLSIERNEINFSELVQGLKNSQGDVALFKENLIKYFENEKTKNEINSQSQQKINNLFFDELKRNNEELHESIKDLVQSAAHMLKETSKVEKSSMKEAIDDLGKVMFSSSEMFTEILNRLSSNQSDFVNSGSETIRQIETALSSSKTVSEAFNNISENIKLNENSIHESSIKLNSAAEKLGEFGATVEVQLNSFKESLDTVQENIRLIITPFEKSFSILSEKLDNNIVSFEFLSNEINNQIKDLKNAYEESEKINNDSHEQIKKLFQESLEDMRTTQKEFTSKIKENLDDVLANGNEFFEKYLRKTDQLNENFQKNLEDQIGRIEEEHKSWMNEYSERVTELLVSNFIEWDKAVGGFAKNMYEASVSLRNSTDEVRSIIDDQNAVTEELLGKINDLKL
jgi:hypothetical protein